MFDRPIIKTYSRTNPTTLFKSSAALVSVYPTAFDKLNVRESRVNEKTLIIDSYDNSFDRILSEARDFIGTTSTQDEKNTSDSERNDVFKKPVSSQRNLRNKTRKKYENDDEKSIKITKEPHFKKIHGIKRKKNSNDSCEEATNSDSQESSDENSIKVIKKSKKKPKKEKKNKVKSPVKNLPIVLVHSSDIPSIEDVNEQIQLVKNNEMNDEINNDKSLDRANSDSIDYGDDFDKSKEESISNVIKRRLLHNIPTSTPREHKLKMMVNMQNLSPIALDKESRLSFKEGKKFTSVNMNKELLDHDISKDSNSNNDVLSSDISLKSKSAAMKSNTEEIINELGKETDNSKICDFNNLTISELLNNDKDKSNSILKYTTQESIVNDKVTEVTPVWSGQKNQVTRSFVESPLMFDDTQDNENKLSKEHSTTLERLKKLSENLAQDPVKRVGKSDQVQANDSSYYPDDWSDDYNSSYEYFSEYVNIRKKHQNEKNENLGEIHIDSDNLFNNKKQSDDNNLTDKYTGGDTEKNYGLLEDVDSSTNLKENKSIDKNSNGDDVEKSLSSSKSEGSDNDGDKTSYLASKLLLTKSTKSGKELNDSLHLNQLPKSIKSLSQSNATNQEIADHDLGSILQLDQSSKNYRNQSHSQNENDSDNELKRILQLDESNKSTINQFQNNIQKKRISNQESKNISQFDQPHTSARDESPNLSLCRSQNQDISDLQLQTASQIDELEKSLREQSPILTDNNSKSQNINDHKMEGDSQLEISKEFIKDQSQIISENHEIQNDIEQSLKAQMAITEETNSNLDAEYQELSVEIVPAEQVEISEETDNTYKVEMSKIYDQVEHTTQKLNAESSIRQLIKNKYNCPELIIILERLDPQTIKSYVESVRNVNKIKVKSKAIGKKKNAKVQSKIKATRKKADKNTKKNIESNSSRKKGQNDKRKLETVECKMLELKQLELSNSNKESSKDNINRTQLNTNINNFVQDENITEKFKIKDLYVHVTKLDDNEINKFKKSRKSDKSIVKTDILALKDLKLISQNNEKRSKVIIKKLNEKEDSNVEEVEKENIVENPDKINDSFNALRSKLNDPNTITMRRRTHKKLDKPALAAITEDQNLFDEDEEEEEHHDEINNMNRFVKPLDSRQSQAVFLKPGKSWARSLSIINHFHSGQNLDDFAAGRGQNWRYSVQSVLNMQNDANQHSTVQNDAERASQLSQRESYRTSTFVTSPNQCSKRFSIRIIPSGKRSTLTDDFMNSQRSSVSDRTRKTSISRKTSLKIRRDTLIETEDDLIKSAKDIILKRCNQISYLPFSESFPDSYIKHCRKIGEGVYGEVFLYDDGEEKSVIKIIPIEGNELVNCEPQKKFHEILSEIIIAEELHKLRFENEYNTNGFVGVNRIMCVVGEYPKKLIDLWKAYDQQKKSENDCPSMFHDQQLYIILELAHGGQDLEAYEFQNASESYAIFLQTAFTLAVAEKSLEFEHRDLHWGNILISKTDDLDTVYKLGQSEVILPNKGVKVSVIDFTLSRMSYKGCKIFNDLAADPTLFEAQGEYQFDIYRMMRNKVDNDWQQFNPYTNILWLDYTLDKMITAVRYKKKTTKVHKTAIQKMKELRQEILKYSSTYEFINNCKQIVNLIRVNNA